MRRFVKYWLATGLLMIGSPALAVTVEFAREVNLEPLKLLAVQHDGYVKTFDSVARTILRFVDGGRAIKGDHAVLTYLDMMIAPEDYNERNILYIKRAPVRRTLINRLESVLPHAELVRISETGLISPRLLDRPEVKRALEELGQDIMRTSKDVDALESANRWRQPDMLAAMWRCVPPPGGDSHALWYRGDEILEAGQDRSTASGNDVHSGMTGNRPLPAGFDEAKAQVLRTHWANLQAAWRKGDASAANQAIQSLAGELATVNPDLYPSMTKRALEEWYYRYHKMTWAWVFYLLSVIALLMAAVYRWPRARMIGLGLFGLAFGLHTVAIGIRWYLAGRIPNANMFEAVTASVWFGALIAIILEIAFRKSAMRNLFAIGTSVAAMAALMCGNFMPVALNSDIGNIMPVLHDLWLYIHTNMIIASYALIGAGYVTAALYLVGRMLARPTYGLWMSMLVPTVIMPAVMMVLPETLRKTMYPLWLPFAFIVGFAVLGWVVRFVLSAAVRERLAMSWEGLTPMPAMAFAGTPTTVLGSGAIRSAGKGPVGSSGEGLGKVLDGATMIFLELSFVTLWTGIVFGAIWADHSWGRPWGWDPKEVFALNTWIVFLVLVHVRLKVKDKGLWTAVLAVVGCAVMLFNWIAVNFFIVGLHSYA